MAGPTDVNRNTRRQPHWNGKNPAQIPDAAPRSRTALDPVAYDNLIKQHGVRVKVYRSMFCPNVKSVDGGEHNIDCTLCNGSGYLDVDPIESVAYLANQNFQEEMTVEGYHDGNTVGGTFLGGVELQYFTRVDLMDFTQPFYERILRNSVNTQTIVGQAAIYEQTFAGTTAAQAHFGDVNNAFGSDSMFTAIGATPSIVRLGSETFTGSNDTNKSRFNVNGDNILRFIPSLIQNTNGTTWASDIARLINDISTDINNPTNVDGTNFVRHVNATSNGVVLTLTQRDFQPAIFTVGSQNPPSTFSARIVQQGIANQFTTEDTLKYDCRRVNVIIDKELNQYYQDIDFVLTPQGNVKWLFATAASIPKRAPTAGTIYTIHYESVIQYRTITAMHINRFAQVPDRSTGLVAQVKMPEQWMLQKEFLIRRRDQFGAEIKATGIYGEVLAAQPLNPAPADTI